MVVTIDERKCTLCVKIMAKINITWSFVQFIIRLRGDYDNWFRSLNNSYPHYDKNNYRVSFF